MPVRFRCPHCQGLMSISTRRIGATVACPVCNGGVVVPEQDALDFPLRVPPPQVEPVPDPATVAPRPEPEFSKQPAALLPGHMAAKPLEDVESPSERSHSPTDDDDPDDNDPETDDDGERSFAIPKSRFAEEDLDLTAMVDVVFQLLIFFMVTASFSMQKTIEVPAPDQPQKGVSQALQPLEVLQDVAILVAVDERNGVTIDDEPLGDLSRLADVLREHMRRDRKSELILTAARESTHRTVITIVDAANQVGMQRIRMATHSRPPD